LLHIAPFFSTFVDNFCFLCFIWYCGDTGNSQPSDYTDSRMQYLTAKLSLTESQAESIRGILTEESSAIQKLRQEYSDDRRGMMSSIRDRKAETVTQAGAVLGEVQKKEYEKLCALGINDDNFVELQAKLALTVDQSDSVVVIFANMRREMQSMREGGRNSDNREGRMMGMRAMREETDEALVKVLTEDQKKIYDRIQEERMEEMRRRFENRGGGMWD